MHIEQTLQKCGHIYKMLHFIRFYLYIFYKKTCHFTNLFKMVKPPKKLLDQVRDRIRLKHYFIP